MALVGSGLPSRLLLLSVYSLPDTRSYQSIPNIPFAAYGRLHSQLTDLGIHRPHRFLVDLWSALTAPFKDVGRTVQEGLLSLMDHLGMQATFNR